MIADTPSIYSVPRIYDVEKPSIYNGRGIYNGVQKNVVEFGGIEYGFVKIGGLLWITENLKNYTPGALYYNNDQNYESLGYLYPTNAIVTNFETQSAFIENLLHDGWRVPKRQDFETLVGIPVNDLKSFGWPTPGTNDSGLNLYLSGTRGYGGDWAFDHSAYISQTATINSSGFYAIITNYNFQVLANSGAIVDEGQRLRSVRICKDA